MNFAGLSDIEKQAHVQSQLLKQIELSCEPGRSREYHHLIPAEVWKDNPVIEALGLQNNQAAYNAPQNRILLPSTHLGAVASGLAMHRSQHPAYTAEVKRELFELNNEYHLHHNGDKAWLAQNFSALQLQLRKSLDRAYALEVPQNYLRADDPLMPVVAGSRLLEMIEGPKLEDEIRKYETDPSRGYPRQSMASMGCSNEFAPATEAQLKAIGTEIKAGAWAGVDRPEPIATPVARTQDPSLIQRIGNVIQATMDFTTAHQNEIIQMGIAASALAASTAAVALTAGAAEPVAAPVQAKSIRTLAVAGTVLAASTLTSNEAAATPATEKIIERLPSLSQLNGQADIMGPRSTVDHISWKFTGLPSGDPNNALARLHARDTDTARPGGPLTDTGAHFLLRANGQLVFSESDSRPLTSNPQLAAGRNANAIGIYVEGDHQLTSAQRVKLESLNQQLEQEWRAQGQSVDTTLQAAGYTEQQAWSPTIPSANQPVSPTLRQTPRMAIGGM